MFTQRSGERGMGAGGGLKIQHYRLSWLSCHLLLLAELNAFSCCHFTLYLSAICHKQVRRFHSENGGILRKRNGLWVYLYIYDLLPSEMLKFALHGVTSEKMCKWISPIHAWIFILKFSQIRYCITRNYAMGIIFIYWKWFSISCLSM